MSSSVRLRRRNLFSVRRNVNVLKCPAVDHITLLAAAVVPGQVERGTLPADEHQLAIVRRRERRPAPGVATDLLRNRDGISGQLERLLVESLGHQISAANVQQM